MSENNDEDEDDLLSSWNERHGKPSQPVAAVDPTIDKRLKEMDLKKEQLRKEKDKKLADLEAKIKKEEEERRKADEERKKKKIEETLKAAGVVEEEEKASFERTMDERQPLNRYSGWQIPKFKVMSNVNIKSANDGYENNSLVIRSVQYVQNTKYMDKETTQLCVHLYSKSDNQNVVRYRNKDITFEGHSKDNFRVFVEPRYGNLVLVSAMMQRQHVVYLINYEILSGEVLSYTQVNQIFPEVKKTINISLSKNPTFEALKGLRSITAVGWNSYRVITPSDEDAEYVKPDRTDTTDTLLVATKDNKLYWLKVDDLLRGSGQNARIKIFGGFLRDVDAENGIPGSEFTITGIEIFHRNEQVFVMMTTLDTVYQFIGDTIDKETPFRFIKNMSHNKLRIIHKFDPAVARHHGCLYVTRNLEEVDDRVFEQEKVQGFAALTTQGIYHGKIDLDLINSDTKQSPILRAEYIDYNSRTFSLDPNRRKRKSYPVSVMATRYHILALYERYESAPDVVVLQIPSDLCRLSTSADILGDSIEITDSVVSQELRVYGDFDEDATALGFAYCPTDREKIYVYTSDAEQIKLINVNSEDADMWECYLDRALQYKEQKQRLEFTNEFHVQNDSRLWVATKLRERGYEYYFEQAVRLSSSSIPKKEMSIMSFAQYYIDTCQYDLAASKYVELQSAFDLQEKKFKVQRALFAQFEQVCETFMEIDQGSALRKYLSLTLDNVQQLRTDEKSMSEQERQEKEKSRKETDAIPPNEKYLVLWISELYLEEFDQFLEKKKMITKYITRKFDIKSKTKLCMDTTNTLYSYGEHGENAMKRMNEVIAESDALKEEMVSFFTVKRIYLDAELIFQLISSHGQLAKELIYMEKVVEKRNLQFEFEDRARQDEEERKKAIDQDRAPPPKREKDFPDVKDWSVVIVDSLVSRGEDRYNFARAIGDKATVISFEMMEAMQRATIRVKAQKKASAEVPVSPRVREIKEVKEEEAVISDTAFTILADLCGAESSDLFCRYSPFIICHEIEKLVKIFLIKNVQVIDPVYILPAIFKYVNNYMQEDANTIWTSVFEMEMGEIAEKIIEFLNKKDKKELPRISFPAILGLDKYIKLEDKAVKEKKRFKLVRKPSPIILLKYLLDWCINIQEVKDEAIHNALLYLPYHQLKGNIAAGSFVGTSAEGRTIIQIKIEQKPEGRRRNVNMASLQDTPTYDVKGSTFKITLEGSKSIKNQMEARLRIDVQEVASSSGVIRLQSFEIDSGLITASEYTRILDGERVECGFEFDCKITGDTPFKGGIVEGGQLGVLFENKSIVQVTMEGVIKLVAASEQSPTTEQEQAVLYASVDYPHGAFKVPLIAGGFTGTLTDTVLKSSGLAQGQYGPNDFNPIGFLTGTLRVTTIGDRRTIVAYVEGQLVNDTYKGQIRKRPGKPRGEENVHYQGVLVDIKLKPTIAEGIQHIFMKYLFDTENGEKTMSYDTQFAMRLFAEWGNAQAKALLCKIMEGHLGGELKGPILGFRDEAVLYAMRTNMGVFTEQVRNDRILQLARDYYNRLVNNRERPDDILNSFAKKVGPETNKELESFDPLEAKLSLARLYATEDSAERKPGQGEMNDDDRRKMCLKLAKLYLDEVDKQKDPEASANAAKTLIKIFNSTSVIELPDLVPLFPGTMYLEPEHLTLESGDTVKSINKANNRDLARYSLLTLDIDEFKDSAIDVHLNQRQCNAAGNCKIAKELLKRKKSSNQAKREDRQYEDAELNEQSRNFIVFPCKHVFHYDCLRRMVERLSKFSPMVKLELYRNQQLMLALNKKAEQWKLKLQEIESFSLFANSAELESTKRVVMFQLLLRFLKRIKLQGQEKEIVTRECPYCGSLMVNTVGKSLTHGIDEDETVTRMLAGLTPHHDIPIKHPVIPPIDESQQVQKQKVYTGAIDIEPEEIARDVPFKLQMKFSQPPQRKLL